MKDRQTNAAERDGNCGVSEQQRAHNNEKACQVGEGMRREIGHYREDTHRGAEKRDTNESTRQKETRRDKHINSKCGLAI